MLGGRRNVGGLNSSHLNQSPLALVITDQPPAVTAASGLQQLGRLPKRVSNYRRSLLATRQCKTGCDMSGGAPVTHGTGRDGLFGLWTSLLSVEWSCIM